MLKLILINLTIIYKRRKFLNYMVFLTIVASIFALVLYYGKDFSIYGNDYERFFITCPKLGFITTFFIYIIPLMVSIPDGDSSIIEKNIYPLILSRTKSKHYYYAKIITSFIVGFITIIYFLSIINIFTIILTSRMNTLNYDFPTLFLTNPSISKLPFLNIYLNNYNLYVYLYTILLGIYGGLLASTSYIIGLFSSQKIMAYIGPFFMSLALLLLISLFGGVVRAWYPQNLFNPAPIHVSFEGVFKIELGILVYIILHTFLLFYLVRIKAKEVV